jgi:hypothetical protein
MSSQRALNFVVLLLIIIGGINWGLIGLANFNLVDTILVANSIVSKIVYVLVGLSALYALTFFSKVSR